VRWLTLLITVLIPVYGLAAGKRVEKKGPKPDWAYVEKRLSKAGFEKSFINALKSNYQAKNFDQVVELNLLLYLRKDNYHGPQVKEKDVSKALHSFVKTHHKTLKEAERKFGVTPGHIAGLLWMETRHGKNQGHFHVPSVFAHLLQADRPQVVAHLKETAKKYTKVDRKIQKEIDSRVKRKSNWALAELKAIAAIYKKNKNALKQWQGSFAGAFGMPQFLPSSYLAYSKTIRKGGIADLRRADDSIMSVANYLHMNGWVKARPKTYEKALYRYNNSHDYTNAIMNLSKKVRLPAAVTRQARN
jgi:membrane-bound lytic murein transglycosylase B